ncbi:helix-turn-helix domain-containing protein [Paenibacillus chartarius]|uniref:Helix-turn-helix domain-containing protein n=1 Tax=Paenibacillus chartarius TaxID=747481 RepID=A0ABV6DK10_9BACL
MQHNKPNTAAAFTAGREEFRAAGSPSLPDLIRSGCTRPEEIQRRLAEQGLHAHYCYPTLALFDSSSGDASAWTRLSETQELYDTLKCYAPRNCPVFFDEIGHVCMLFSWDDRDTIRALHSSLLRHDTRHLRTVTVGIGNPSQHLTELHTGFAQAMSALNHKFYQGTGQIIYFNSIGSYSNEAVYPDDQEEELLRLIDEQAPQRAEQAVDSFYEALLRSGPLPREEVDNITIHLLISLELRIKMSTGQIDAPLRPDIMAVLTRQTLQEIKAAVRDYVKRIAEASTSKDNQNRTIIKKALTLMEGEYDKATLHSVAEKVYITPAYLSTLFKTNTGVTFIEHLTEIRIAKAKKLLKQTQLKNYEVAEKVGYQDSRYFSQIFKKKVGLSPSEFRDAN